MTVGAATPGDVAALTRLELDAFPGESWTADYLRVAIDGQMPTIRVRSLRIGEEVVGYAIVSVVFEVAELQRVAVAPAYRRRGLARALVADVVSMAAEAAAERLLLEVAESNTGARALYASLGFAEIDRRERYYRDGATAVVLELDLHNVDHG